MYAVIVDSGVQYRIEKNSEILVDSREAAAGDSIVFDNVIALGGEGSIATDAKDLEKASVSGTVLGDAKGPKLVIGKFKRRKKYRRKTGHRQQYLRVRIDDIKK